MRDKNIESTDDSESKQTESEAEFSDVSKTPRTEDAMMSGFQTLLEASEIISKRDSKQKPSVSTPLKESPAKEESEREERPSFLAEHDYFAAPLIRSESEEQSNDVDMDTDGTESAEEDGGTTPLEVFIDHNYCLPPKPSMKEIMEERKQSKPKSVETSVNLENIENLIKSDEKKKKEPTKRGKRKKDTLVDITDVLNKSRGSRELINLLPPPTEVKKFSPRKMEEERQIFFDLYSQGLDIEDINYLKRTYDHLLQSEDPNCYWITDILWVDHPVTHIPDPVPSKRRKKETERAHKTGIKNYSTILNIFIANN